VIFATLGIHGLLLVIPPIAALLGVLFWYARPRLRRNEVYRLTLSTSVSLAALEAIVAALFLFVLVLFSRSGGMQTF